ncbi:MAG: Jag N-terminal domain-containing protein [Anaerolineae bacterium]|nr:Jag N-terminal domain-containing protein [Anaerolineae bacterium]
MSDTRSVETSAPDIESAIEQGLRELGVARESVIVEILEEPSRGLLGIGARQARIRLTTAAPARAAAPTPPVALPAAVAGESAPAEEEDEPGEEAAAPPAEDADAFDDDTLLADAQPISDSELDEDARVGVATLEELLAKMEIKARVAVYRARSSEDEETPWVLQIQGADLGVLIGRRGETLAALQYITRLIASRDLQRRANIVIDVEGYKARREKQLHRLARRMAEQALQIGRTVTLEPMPPYERRIIHLALRDHPQVTTQSVGEGEHRKVTIIPDRR